MSRFRFVNHRYEGEPRLYDSELHGPDDAWAIGHGDTLLAAITDAERKYVAEHGETEGLHAAVMAERRRHI